MWIKRRPLRILFHCQSFCFAAMVMSAQDSPRPAGAVEAEKTARELFNSGDYDKAIPILERAVSDYPNDIKDLSVLGMAYLYSSSRIDLASNSSRARDAMDKAIQQGGEAIFLVGRADDPLKSLSKYIVKAIQGELRIGKGRLSFSPNRGSAGVLGPLSGMEVKECGLNKGYGKDSNAFHIKTAKETVNFRPLHFSEDESNLACSLAAKYLGVKIAN